MRHPPYHLRPNKAVDRLTLIEAIRLLAKLEDLSEYTYYCFGGPYLEDCRLLYEFHPEIKMVSIEEDEETYKRQNFHLPCGTLELTKAQFTSFLAEYQANDKKSIFWIDYTGLEYAHFEDLMVLLSKVATNSMIKVTLRCEPQDFLKIQDANEFRKKFETLLPSPSTEPPSTSPELAYLIQEMIQIASQIALPSAMPHVFQPLSSFFYADRAGMFTLTGLVCTRNEQPGIRRLFQGMQFANLTWERPKNIDVPVLSTKERLRVQRLLPKGEGAGRILREELGYLIDEDRAQTENRLQQYADFHRYFPYFMKAIP